MFCIVICTKGAAQEPGDQDEVVGPFNSEREAGRWIDRFSDDDHWYDIIETTLPDFADETGRVTPNA